MDPSLYKIITSGNIHQLKQIADDQLFFQMTPLNNTTLHVAVKSNKIVFVEEICKRCPSLLTQANSKGDTPLHVAARLGLFDIASFLIDRFKSNQEDIESRGEGNGVVVESVPVQQQQLVRMRNNEKDTALHEAVRNRRFEVVKLLTEADPTHEYLECNNAGETPLYLAAEDGLLDCVVKILQTCPTSAHGGPRSRTVLHAAVRSKNSDVTKFLLHTKPDLIKEADEYGCTALHYAIYFGMPVMIVQLLDVDPSIAYMPNKDGNTALHVAASMHYNSTEIIEELTQRCPDCWELLDNKGQNFLHVAARNGNYKGIEYAIRQENMMVEDLINQPEDDGNTPLHLASMFQRAKIVKILCSDKRVNKTIVNKITLTAMDPIYSDLVKDPYDRFLVDIYNDLKEAGARCCWRKQIIKEKGQSRRNHQNKSDIGTEHLKVLEKRKKTDLLVATLIATVTFAAGFTLPGGYNSDGPHKGMATLARRPAFIVFVLSNSVAMLLSTFAVFVNFWPFPIKGKHDEEMKQMHLFCADLGYWCTNNAITAMVVAFITGTYAVLLDLPGLAIPACILGCSFFLLYAIVLYKAYKLIGISVIGGFYIPPPKK